MEKDSLALSFSDSLTEGVSVMVGEFAEIGIDAIMDEGLLKDIPWWMTSNTLSVVTKIFI